jgi:hypothetical protein
MVRLGLQRNALRHGIAELKGKQEGENSGGQGIVGSHGGQACILARSSGQQDHSRRITIAAPKAEILIESQHLSGDEERRKCMKFRSGFSS